MSGDTKRVVMAMSGGVDSSVAAALLCEAGYEVVGLFMRHGVEAAPRRQARQAGLLLPGRFDGCPQGRARLGVPFYAINFSADFGRIIDYFAAEYDAGRTPNPCIQCNRWLKFGKLLDYADEIGASHVATGHYAGVELVDGRYTVTRGRDRDKDQSYVLFPLSQEQLARTLLPLGGLTKSEVRQRAEDLGLEIFNKPDSQEICFVPDNDYGGFLKRRTPENIKPGPLVELDGTRVGTHEGYQLYTIGQRKGLGGGFSEPRYVVDIRPDDNSVVIGGATDLLAEGLEFNDPTWQLLEAPAPGEILDGEVKIRYAHQPRPARLEVVDGSVRVMFEEPLRAVTTGQGAVFYQGDRVVCGGFIDRVLKARETIREPGGPPGPGSRRYSDCVAPAERCRGRPDSRGNCCGGCSLVAGTMARGASSFAGS